MKTWKKFHARNILPFLRLRLSEEAKTMSILVSKKVTKRFGGLEAVSKVDFDLPENAIYSIIGPNGAGKTTFFFVTGFHTLKRWIIIPEYHPSHLNRITRLGV
jgi:ABC-type branched-subunit amino acid transport system ATPase component